ncbi:PP2C family protein-serine/threonine phosphatase [Cellulomonas denverensis]|uniref:Serine/threonine-protein phosphatase n=1 Tax=Cellulomonas denverensis TaxID=264297 RepID=A0A7X6KT95_9CELL|nr:protein phosphatase 2C domain-containing protein [Cellulomonas denverensis]NKY21380.1 serine/threonine-protein phosphatase [Cellulomonas denverensis]GIG27053.1 serine/threonine protein phosphatase [Cellulomonas denverensis]
MTSGNRVVAGVELAWAAGTDPGRVRRRNEDALLAEPPVFVVPDGMGGLDAGDRASAAVTAALAERLTGPGPVTVEAVGQALNDAQQRVCAISAGTGRGAGSTVTGAAVVEHGGTPHWLVFNIGDSRVYRHSGDRLARLTRDHQAPASHGTRSHAITRALGTGRATADRWLLPITTGDRLLVCSDGLHGELPDESLRAALTLAGTAESAVAALIRLANRAGGRDNITVVVVDVRAGGATGSTNLAGTTDTGTADTTRRVLR